MLAIKATNMKKFKLPFLIILASMVFITSCKDDEPTPDPNNDFTINFEHLANNAALQWDTLLYTNELNQNYETSTLKYFVSAIYLHQSNGDSIMVKDIHYVDGRENIGTTLTTSLPAKEYTGFSIVFGIPAHLNETNMFTLSPESNMEWPVPMGGGYHYMKFEGKYKKEDATKQNFQMHTGPLKMVDYSIYRKFDINISLLNDASVTLTQHMDKWMTTPNTLDLADITMIMGNAAMQQKLQENGNDVLTLQ